MAVSRPVRRMSAFLDQSAFLTGGKITSVYGSGSTSFAGSGDAAAGIFSSNFHAQGSYIGNVSGYSKGAATGNPFSSGAYNSDFTGTAIGNVTMQSASGNATSTSTSGTR